MAVFPVVLDSCVLYNAAIRDTLLRAAAIGLYRPHWSEQILDDTLRNLIEDGRLASPGNAERLRTNLTRAFADAVVDVPKAQTEAMRNHEGDRHVAAAAVVSHSQVIVTWNLKHFPAEAFDLQPALLRQILADQAAELRNPPMTPAAWLDRLARDVPAFIERVRSSEELGNSSGGNA